MYIYADMRVDHPRTHLQLQSTARTPSTIQNLFPNLYAFPLFLTKFHSVNPFNGNFCEPGRARFAEEKMEFHLGLSAKRILFYFLPVSNFRTRSHDERAEWTSSWCGLCSKTWNLPPNGGGNFVSFHMEKVCFSCEQIKSCSGCYRLRHSSGKTATVPIRILLGATIADTQKNHKWKEQKTPRRVHC